MAVDGLSLRFDSGRVLALVGENGAGKTTAMRIAAGVIPPDSGFLTMHGERVAFVSPRDASHGGIEMVHQHFMLVPRLTVAENLALADASLGRWISPRGLLRRAEEMIQRSGIALANPQRLVSDLSVGEKAKVELIKTLSRNPRVLILDEPTAVLAPVEVDELFAVLRRLAGEGIAVVFITHKLGEVFALADDVAVMRGGQLVLESSRSLTSAKDLAGAMVGQPWVSEVRPSPERVAGDILLECEGVSTARTSHADALNGLDVEVREGEIVAIVGVAGNGQHALAEVLRGVIPVTAGTIRHRGSAVTHRDLLGESSIGHIPPDRTQEGVVAELSVAENIALGAVRWSRSGSLADARSAIDRFRIRTPSPHEPAGTLSGGNQQKVVLARELERSPDVIVASEPTRGLDIDATRFVHGRLRDAARRGAGILLITSDLDEAFELSSAMHVIYRGRLSERLPGDVDLRVVGQLMAGVA